MIGQAGGFCRSKKIGAIIPTSWVNRIGSLPLERRRFVVKGFERAETFLTLSL